MVYTDEELQRWWKGLTRADQRALVETMVERAPSRSFKEFARSLLDRLDKSYAFSPKQLSCIRKWDRPTKIGSTTSPSLTPTPKDEDE